MIRSVKVTEADVRLFARAADEARNGEHHRVRVGAILKRGSYLRAAHNRMRNDPDNVEFPHSTIHAERDALDGAPAFKGTLYVARIDLNDRLAPSWPCPLCMMYIKSCACVSKICYYDDHNAILKVRI